MAPKITEINELPGSTTGSLLSRIRSAVPGRLPRMQRLTQSRRWKRTTRRTSRKLCGKKVIDLERRGPFD